MKSGERVTGTYGGGSTTNGDLGCVINFAKLVKSTDGNDVILDDYLGGGPSKTVVIEPKDLVDITTENITLGEIDGLGSQNGMSYLYSKTFPVHV